MATTQGIDLERQSFQMELTAPLMNNNNEDLMRLNEEKSKDLTQQIKGPDPTRVTCPHCGFNGMTSVKLKASSCAKFSACIMTLICLCCVPLCMRGNYNAVHSC